MAQPPIYTAREIREETLRQIKNRLFKWCRQWQIELTDAQYDAALYNAQHSTQHSFVTLRRNARRDAIRVLRATTQRLRT